MSNAEHPGAPSSANGESPLGDLFALSDEQILEIEPEVKVVSGQSPVPKEGPVGAGLAPPGDPATQSRAGEPRLAPTQATAATPSGAPDTPSAPGAAEAPPKWLADMMANPQRGGEAKQFWEQTQQAGTRARQLEELDRAYFAGDGPARERLAETLLREDPAAFREMVFAGLKALEGANGAPPLRAASSGLATPTPENAGLKPGATQATAPDLAANEELDRDVGGTIARALEQALPSAAKADSAPLRDRLASAIRQDIEAALKGDRQLGEQVALIISGKRPGEAGMHTAHFDDTTRAQVVRLIGERARQLVPVAAKRVLNDWTQTALGAHRARAQKSEAAAARPDVEGVGGAPASARAKSAGPREVDYRKLSDAQILDL